TGKTGIGLALAAFDKKLSVLFCVPEQFGIEKQQLMKALGAKIINTPSSKGMQGAIDRAEQLLANIPNSYSPQQFSNRINPGVYYKTLAPEVWKDLNGAIDIFVAVSGSAGTFMGSFPFFIEKNPDMKYVILVTEGLTISGG